MVEQIEDFEGEHFEAPSVDRGETSDGVVESPHPHQGHGRERCARRPSGQLTRACLLETHRQLALNRLPWSSTRCQRSGAPRSRAACRSPWSGGRSRSRGRYSAGRHSSDSTSGHPRRFGARARSPTVRDQAGMRREVVGGWWRGGHRHRHRPAGCSGCRRHARDSRQWRRSRDRAWPRTRGQPRPAPRSAPRACPRARSAARRRGSVETDHRQRAAGRRAGDQQVDQVGFGRDLRRKPLEGRADQPRHQRRRHVAGAFHVPLGGIGRCIDDVGRHADRLGEHIGIGGRRGCGTALEPGRAAEHGGVSADRSDSRSAGPARSDDESSRHDLELARYDRLPQVRLELFGAVARAHPNGDDPLGAECRLHRLPAADADAHACGDRLVEIGEPFSRTERAGRVAEAGGDGKPPPMG